MTDTQKRIKAYQELLPALRERVIAVALLLAMSVSMLSSASFAWLTLSRNPEVTAVNTTVAANGNLEIALATGEQSTATAPGESQVGDSSAAKGQSVTAANVTWGNLVNLADPSYGLEKMVLRPAMLNRTSLLDSPLYGATYGTDGRTDRLASDFAYASWEPKDESIGRMEDSFVIGDKLGVRAITSIRTGESSEHQVKYKNRLTAAETANGEANTLYQAIINNSTLMNSLASIMGTYLQNSVLGSGGSFSQSDMKNLGEIFFQFIKVYDKQIEAMVHLANLQLFALSNGGDFTEYTRETLMASTKAERERIGVKLDGFETLKTDYATLNTYYNGEPMKGGVRKENMVEVIERSASESIAFADIEHIVDSLVVIGNCEIIKNGTTYKVSSIGFSEASGMLSGTADAVITNGVLYNFEKLNGLDGAYIKKMKIKVSFLSVTANIYTSANRAADFGQFQAGIAYAKDNNKGGEPVAYTEDTYGLAIDLWTRTNAEGSYLTLEGNVLTRKDEILPTITVNEDSYFVTIDEEEIQVYPAMSEEGQQVWYNAVTNEPINLNNQSPEIRTETKTYDLYTVTFTQTEENTGLEIGYNVDIYQKTKPDGTQVWCNATSNAEMTAEEMEGKTPVRKVEVIETVIGFEGENRVWNKESDSLIPTDATTQGSGSCYVYYADNPEDQASSLELLQSFKVAFIDGRGKLLATASMDTANHYATAGRVIVPLKLDTDECIVLENPATGELTYAITELEKNVPTRITALVYLDGTNLFNENVLAASEIQGRLNIQFGSTMAMEPMRNTELEDMIRSVSASIDKTKFDYDTEDDLKTKVTVTVNGDSPSNVTAFFLREISATQGSREEVFTFTKTGEATWEGEYTFPAPGNYLLRTVQLDGIEYDLPEGQPLRVEVTGFGLESLSCIQGNNLEVKTTAGSHTVDLRLKFAAEDENKMPRKVEGHYLREDGTAVNVSFTRGTGNIWSGSATFVASGKYTMQYLILDDHYTPLAEEFWLKADLTMGMRVSVETKSPTKFPYKPDDMTDEQRSLAMEVRILDGEGNMINSIPNPWLYYGKAGSADKYAGMSTQLTWDGVKECYTGTFASKVGTYRFHSVEAGSNTLTVATSSPVFQIMPPDSPVFTDDVTSKYLFMKSAAENVMKVKIEHSEAASVKAVLIREVKDANGKSVFSEHDVVKPDENTNWLDGTGVWNIPIPEVDGSQDGYWKIKELHVYDAYAPDGTFYTLEKPLVIDAEDKNVKDSGGFVRTKVVSEPTIVLHTPEGWDAELGKTNGKVDGVFLTEYTISGLSITMKDFENNPLTDAAGNVATITMSYLYGGDAKTFGGYEGEKIKAETISVTMEQDSNDPTTYKQKNDITVRFAGTYTPVVQFKLGNTTYELDESTFTFSVHSVKPKVTVTAVTPATTETIPTKIKWTRDRIGLIFKEYALSYTLEENKNNILDSTNNEVTVYAKATSSDLGTGDAGFIHPTLQFTVNNVDDTSVVKFTIPAGSADAKNVEIKGNNTSNAITLGKKVTVYDMGKGYLSITYTLYGYRGHGDQTIKQVTVEQGTDKYTVTLDKPIIIHNPSSVDQNP